MGVQGFQEYSRATTLTFSVTRTSSVHRHTFTGQALGLQFRPIVDG